MKTLSRIMVCVALLCSSQLAEATPMIVVGEHELLPDTPNQTIPIMVTGGDSVQGLNFRFQVADGGTHPQAGGSIIGPSISDIDLMTGTIFDGNNTGQNDLLKLPQIWVQSITASANTVVADGLLATVTVDTTGFMTGDEFELRIGDTLDSATDFAGVPVDITDGMLRIGIPEPTGVVMMITGLALLCTARRRVGQRWYAI